MQGRAGSQPLWDSQRKWRLELAADPRGEIRKLVLRERRDSESVAAFEALGDGLALMGLPPSRNELR